MGHAQPLSVINVQLQLDEIDTLQSARFRPVSYNGSESWYTCSIDVKKR